MDERVTTGGFPTQALNGLKVLSGKCQMMHITPKDLHLIDKKQLSQWEVCKHLFLGVQRLWTQVRQKTE